MSDMDPERLGNGASSPETIGERFTAGAAGGAAVGAVAGLILPGLGPIVGSVVGGAVGVGLSLMSGGSDV